MTINILTYNKDDLQSYIDSSVDFELAYTQNKIVIEIPKGLLNMVLKPEDGVLMEPGHQSTLENYVDIIATNKSNNKVLAYLRIRKQASGTEKRDMKREHLVNLLAKIPAFVKDIDDPAIQSEYFSSEIV